jgi:hypothetical protein
MRVPIRLGNQSRQLERFPFQDMRSPNTSIAGDAADRGQIASAGRGLLSTYYGSKIWTAPAVAAAAKILNIVKLPELVQAGKA